MRENTMQPTAGSGKKRSGFKVMAELIGLVKPLSGYMCLAIVAGVLGHLCAAFITILGGYAVLAVLGLQQRCLLRFHCWHFCGQDSVTGSSLATILLRLNCWR